ncbi:multiple sugar transport system permease protein [Caloramator quimbayensis]|uniref:Multiple sugar transport system permease protein n=1 Tax=Caloramator quimbayensis TaxID=1147123 RepID=A0A1T4XEI7_9CLOT|nr:sugar ABC transporter permease [Caloramator quimbayensis]SKA87984.1 multiple sugar transport system permease protein [Caloramator quimbayensis]
MKKKDNITAYLFLMPVTVLFLIFSVIPIIYSLYLSFIMWNGFSINKKFVGFNNYVLLFSNNEFYHSFIITIVYTVLVTTLSIIIGMILAYLLNKNIRFRSLYRTMYFIPVITATAAAGVIWKYMFDSSQGIINKFLNFIHLPAVPWLSHPIWVIISISLVGVWKRIGFNMVIYISALQSISPLYYEACEIDGATKGQKFRYITVPLLKPTTLLLVIMSFIDSFQIFDQVYVMTNGGPMGASDVLGLYLYREGFKVGHLGYGSAIGWVIFAFIFAATLIQLKINRKGEEVY